MIAWDYPPRGSIIASCGHRLHGGDLGEIVSYWDWSEDGSLAEFCSTYCPWCAIRTKVSGRLVEAEQ